MSPLAIFLLLVPLPSWSAPSPSRAVVFLNSGNVESKRVTLGELVSLYETSPMERTRVHKKLGLNFTDCRAATPTQTSLDDDRAAQNRMIQKSSKLKLSFLIENLKKAQKPRQISRSDLTFLGGLGDCSSLAEELVTLSQLSDNWDLIVSE